MRSPLHSIQLAAEVKQVLH